MPSTGGSVAISSRTAGRKTARISRTARAGSASMSNRGIQNPALAPGLAAFVVNEARVKQPMLPLRLFRKPAFTGVQLAALGVSASMFALFLYITFYLQNHLGHSPLEAGLIYLPFTVISFFAAAAGGALEAPAAAAPMQA